MDSLANYGSDDDFDDSNGNKTGTPPQSSAASAGRSRRLEADVNYDEVQMDLSEEESSSNNNSSPALGEIAEQKYQHHRSSHRSRSRSRENTAPRHKKRSSPDNDSRSRRRRSSKHDDTRKSPKRREERSSGKHSKEERTRKRSSRRSNSRERRRRSRSRSPPSQRSDYKKQRPEEDCVRHTKRFDRTTNKMAQLEKLGIEIKTPDAEFVTPQMLLQRSMKEQVQRVKKSTGIELPKYYNPSAVNPSRYAEQIQKRRLLWQKKETPPEETSRTAAPATATSMEKVWKQTTFAQDSDGKVASKFKRLMGIKDADGGAAAAAKDVLKKQEEMFSSMEQQYEVARTATHTMRGVGLGFGAFHYPR